MQEGVYVYPMRKLVEGEFDTVGKKHGQGRLSGAGGMVDPLMGWKGPLKDPGKVLAGRGIGEQRGRGG